MKAIWGMDYDLHTDSCYNRPCCPECREPIGKDVDGLYHCYSCGKVVEVADDEMKKWFADREETKVEVEDHPIVRGKNGITFGCGGKQCLENHYHRNQVTLEWEVGWAECRNCGAKIIV